MNDKELIGDFLVWKQHNQGRADATVSKYGRYLERLRQYGLDEHGKGLLQLSLEDLEHFAGMYMHQAGLSPRARRTLVAAIRGFYLWAHRTRRLAENPAEGLPYPKAGRKLPVALELDAAERLLMAPDLGTFLGVRDAAILAVFVGCGVRVSGLVAMNEGDLRFVRGTDGGELLIIRVREKGTKERLLPAPHETRLLVRAYLGHEELEGIDRTLPDGDRVLWVSVQNRGVTPDQYHGEARRLAARSINDLIIRHAERAGIPRNQAHPHAIRHLYGTELAESEVHILQMQALLGHADPKTTQIYTQLAMRKLAEAVLRGNPLSKIRTPVSELLDEMERRR